MNDKDFSWKKRASSFRYAFAGIAHMLRHEHNARLHCAAAVAAIVCGFAFDISAGEWIAIVLCIAIVFAAETFNTALETLADRVSPDFDKAVGTCKDLAAGAVLITAIGALAIGAIIFVPKLIEACQ